MRNRLKRLLLSSLAIMTMADLGVAQYIAFGEDLDLNNHESLAALATIANAKIVIKQGPKYAAVQPTVHLSFDYASCSGMAFELKTLETDSVLFIAADLTQEYDCMGMAVKRNYLLQISSDIVDKQIIILNPIMQGEQLPYL